MELIRKSMKKLLFFLFITIIIGNNRDKNQGWNQEFRTIVENASRSSQKVFVEDFTGLQ